MEGPFKVDSSNLSLIGYDAGSGTLFVTFKSGETYQYAGVPPALWEGLNQAESKGSYLAKHIKGVHPHSRV